MKDPLIDVESKKNLSKKDENENKIYGLTYNIRLIILILLNIVGYILQMDSFSRFYQCVIEKNPENFGFLYSLGSISSLFGATIFFGFKIQIKRMNDISRKNISIIFIISILFCLFSPLMPNNRFFYSIIILAIFIQIVTYWYYFLTFFPTLHKFFRAACIKTTNWITTKK